MIDLGRPALHAEGVTLFADHADERVLHYIPDRPGLRMTPAGDPELLLLKYRLDGGLQDAAVAALGNGVLTLTVDLAVADATLAKLRARAAARTGISGVVLTPVAAESGRADLTLLGATTMTDGATDAVDLPPAGGNPADPPGGAAAPATGGVDAGPGVGPVAGPGDGAPDAPGPTSTFVIQPLRVGSPMLYGDKAAMFSAVLSAEGATLVEQAMRSGGLPLGVVYRLQVTGIRPALRARITARWQDAYRFFENRLHGGKLLLATDIGPTVEDLVHAEAITVDIDELVPAADRDDTLRRALDEVQRYVLQELFTPTLGTQPPGIDQEAEGLAAIGTAIKDVFGIFSLTYSLRKIRRDELKTFRYDLSTAQAELLTLSPQGMFTDRLSGAAVDRLVREVEPTVDPEMVFRLGAARDLAAEDIERIEVRLRYGDREVPVVLDPQTPRADASIWFDPALGPEIAWDYTVFFRPASGDVDQVSSSSRTGDERVIVVDPRELYDRVQLRLVAQGVPFDRYPRVLVDLRYTQPVSGWTAESTLELGAQTPEVAQVVRVSPDRPLVVQRRLRYVDTAGRVTTLDWDTTDPGVVVVGNPAPDIADLQIVGSARFGTAVARLIVELRPHDDPGRVQTRLLTAEAPVAAWSFAPTGEDRGYDYRVTVHGMSGEVKDGQWQVGPPGRLIVGEGFAALRAISLYLVGGSPAAHGLMAVKVRFSFSDPDARLSAEHEVLVTDTAAPIPWSYPVAAPDRVTFTVTLTGIRNDGTAVDVAPITTGDLLVIAPMPSGG